MVVYSLLALHLGLCARLAWEDYHSRTVHVGWLALNLLAILAYPQASLGNLLPNLAALALILFVSKVYLRLRGRRGAFFAAYFGVGDLVFLVSIAPILSPRVYLSVVLGGSFLGLLYGVLAYILKREIRTVPYITALALPTWLACWLAIGAG